MICCSLQLELVGLLIVVIIALRVRVRLSLLRVSVVVTFARISANVRLVRLIEGAQVRLLLVDVVAVVTVAHLGAHESGSRHLRHLIGGQEGVCFRTV